LIDDDSDFLQVISQRCSQIGLNVQNARNLLTATALIDGHLPDVICVDIEMPTGNGLRFCESLADDPRTAQVPIIVLSGRKDDETLRACERLGAHFAFKSADAWRALEPLVRQILAELPEQRPPSMTGIRPRNLPNHLIPQLPAEQESGSQTASAAGRQVVVADDDADLVQSLSERLGSCGCSVIGVHSSLDAINAIHRVRPDLVILDVNMPSGSGLGICELMATDEQLRVVPAIILTGCSDKETIRRCHDMMVFYVQKGVDVWSRIEPLVRELLHLGDAPIPDQPAAEKPVPKPAPKAAPQKVPVAPDDSHEAGALMDTVFAILGGHESPLHGGSKANDDSWHDVVDSPWVLCIDDDYDYSDTLRIRFAEYGVAVACASNGMAGYRMAFSTPARAILLDYQMPNGQGDYILDRLKSNPVTQDIPVFMITGVRNKSLERRVMAMGAAGYFLKPVEFESLRKRLAEIIDALAVRTCVTV